MAAVTMATIAVVTGCGGSGGSPEETVEAVLDARTAGECDGYEQHFVDEDDPFPRCGDPEPEVGDGPQVDKVEIDGDAATVEVVDHYDCSGWDEPDHEYVDVYHLVRNGGSWKVDDWTPSEATSDDCFS